MFAVCNSSDIPDIGVMVFGCACGRGCTSVMMDAVLLDLGLGTSWNCASDMPDDVVNVGGHCMGVPGVGC